jgi:hypothetical protein
MFPIALYKSGGKHQFHGGSFDYKTADNQSELDASLKDGWYLTTVEAVEAKENGDSDDKTKLIELAKSLGINANGTWGLAKLNEAIALKHASNGAKV